MRQRIWECISDYAKDLVFKMLTVDADKRISASEALRHPWLKVGRHLEVVLSFPGMTFVAHQPQFPVCRVLMTLAIQLPCVGNILLSIHTMVHRLQMLYIVLPIGTINRQLKQSFPHHLADNVLAGVSQKTFTVTLQQKANSSPSCRSSVGCSQLEIETASQASLCCDDEVVRIHSSIRLLSKKSIKKSKYHNRDNSCHGFPREEGHEIPGGSPKSRYSSTLPKCIAQSTKTCKPKSPHPHCLCSKNHSWFRHSASFTRCFRHSATLRKSIAESTYF